MAPTAIEVIGIFSRARVPQCVKAIKFIVSDWQRTPTVAIRARLSLVARANRIIVAIGAIHRNIDTAQTIDNRLESGEINPRVVMYIDAEVVEDGLSQQSKTAPRFPLQVFADAKCGIQPTHIAMRNVDKKVTRQAQHGYRAGFNIY